MQALTIDQKIYDAKDVMKQTIPYEFIVILPDPSHFVQQSGADAAQKATNKIEKQKSNNGAFARQMVLHSKQKVLHGKIRRRKQ